MDEMIKVVFENLRRIQTEGGDDNFVVFQFSPEIYIQFAGQPGESQLYGEAVSNKYLDGFQLDETQHARMLALGWKAPGKNDPNYFQNFEVTDDSRRFSVARLVLETIEQVYRIQLPIDIEVNLNLE